MKKQTAGQWALDLVILTLGSAFVAAGLVLFTIPNNIAPGGVSGLATALASITPLSVGVWTILFNVPLVAAAWRMLGLRPILKTVIATLLLSLFIDLFSLWLPGYTENVLLASLFGGVLTGAGMGVIFARGASTGGTDLVSLLLNRAIPYMSVGSLLLCVDALVVIFAALVFGNIDVVLYSAITLYVSTKVIDSILDGLNYAKVVFVITEKGEEMRSALNEEQERGVTILEAQGGYTRRGKHMLVIVARRTELAQVLRIAKSVDKGVFAFVTNATEVHGEGFRIE
ncbi:MAG: YitT family protein [Oscillospiraceae bacterium]|nr:YitT family protein [Oscillospiraceae bacterium]